MQTFLVCEHFGSQNSQLVAPKKGLTGADNQNNDLSGYLEIKTQYFPDG